VDHLFGAGAGQPALYAVVAVVAVFTSAARAPLTSLASVVEMSGDFSLTLPVMLAVAIATTVSRALSYGTIYTTKLLRRGADIDRAAPWRALQDLEITNLMRPFPAALPVPPDSKAAAAGPDGTAGDPGRECTNRGITLAAGDRVSLLVPAARDFQPRDAQPQDTQPPE
jgi:CIC family chloride channel protein